MINVTAFNIFPFMKVHQQSYNSAEFILQCFYVWVWCSPSGVLQWHYYFLMETWTEAPEPSFTSKSHICTDAYVFAFLFMRRLRSAVIVLWIAAAEKVLVFRISEEYATTASKIPRFTIEELQVELWQIKSNMCLANSSCLTSTRWFWRLLNVTAFL